VRTPKKPEQNIAGKGDEQPPDLRKINMNTTPYRKENGWYEGQ
jgi:hypothetical protein